jgi:hypothetical protein
MVKIFTMVKDEVDIVRDWVIYHGCLFGWNNIYVIDNFSTDGTYEALLEFKHLIYITRREDYRKKGEYMTELMKTFCNNNEPICFPIDIDEFIVYLKPNSKEISVDKKLINDYIKKLPVHQVYKANYVIVNPKTPDGHKRATTEIEYGKYADYKNAAKSFVDIRHFKGSIDHGNHIACDNYLLTNIVLVHYHERNIEQMNKKSRNNVIGLGYPIDLNGLKNLHKNTPNCMGLHHVITQISIQEKKYKLHHNANPNPSSNISVIPLKKIIISGYF